MADKNTYEQAITPYNPSPSRVLSRDKYNLYTPLAGNTSPGIASFDSKDFNVNNGRVSLANMIKNGYIKSVSVKPDESSIINLPGDIVYNKDGDKTPAVLYNDYTHVVKVTAIVNGESITQNKAVYGSLLVTRSTQTSESTYTNTETLFADGDVWVRAVHIDGNIITYEDFRNVGDVGPIGPPGPRGEAGKNGITPKLKINDNGELIATFNE